MIVKLELILSECFVIVSYKNITAIHCKRGHEQAIHHPYIRK